MSATLDRLRRLQELRPQRTRPEPEAPPSPEPLPQPVVTPRGTTRLEELVPGEILENSAGLCYVRTQAYPLASARGQYPLGNLLARHPITFAPFHPNFGLRDTVDFRQAAFIDTETTGLGGGAGVYCFMVGVGTFECGVWSAECGIETNHPNAFPASSDPTHFVVRQFFMRNPAEEGALMFALAELLERYEMSVTFNGRTFDLPLLRTRLQQNQRMYPDLRGSARLLAAERPHLDLLHPARRLWKRRLQSCRLINLEQMILGLQRSEEDVPGHLIPMLYTDYMRTGNAHEMRRVFYHNCEDIVSMVALADHLGRAYAEPAAQSDTPLQGLDWLAMGQCYEKLGQLPSAENAYQQALALLREPAAQADAYQALAQVQKRQGNWPAASETWQRWLTSVPGNDLTPYIELAKYCEWQSRDLEQAEMWTGWALHNLRKLPVHQREPGQIEALEHRLQRIQRKRQDGAGTASTQQES